MHLTLAFTDPEACRHEFSGGKGANLSLLTQRGFPVPVGFIVTAEAYREFIHAADTLCGRVAAFDYADATRLQQQGAELRGEIEQLPLSAGLEASVRQRLAGYADDAAFSVRSSSTFEDLASAAFAGQHDTYLNIHGADAILERIRACFASLWQDRAIAYRERLGFDQMQATMAVVVQTMIPSEVSGVGFTINPISGNIDEMLVNANFGLGESVVSGEGAIDQFVLARDGSLRSSSIGEKTQRIVNTAQGTVEVEVEGAAASQVSLDPAQLAELADLMRRVEASYQFPQDIEWAISAGKLWLLQSRPVTSIPPRWTRDESAERFPNVITPLAWEMVEDGFHRSLNHSFKLMGYPPFSGKWFAMFGHYIYGNQNAVEIYGRRMPFVIRNLDELEAAIPHLRSDYAWVQDLPLEWSRDLDYYLLTLGELSAENLQGGDLQEVWQYVLRVNRLGADYFLPNIAISITQRTLYRLLHGLLQMLTGNPQEAAALFDTLIAHTETKTGIINKELAAMADDIRDHAELTALVDSTPSQELIASGRLDAFGAFSARFAKFLRDHGHREVDFDPYQPTWVDAPWLVLDNLRLMAGMPKAGAHEHPRERERKIKLAMHEAELGLYARIPQRLHFFFHELLRLVRAYTTLDDVEHYHTTRLTLPLRKGLRRLGEHLRGRGVVEDPMDVFFAHYRPLEEAVRCDDPATWTALAQAIREEKSAWLQRRDAPPAWNLDDAADEVEEETSGAVLSGLAGSAGMAEGEVYVVRSPADFALFPKGAVLVARTTNPAWTPLFYSACAVVTESGGPLSHGAVTAREMQIPAVMSVRGVLLRLSNGQRVRVDGRKGRVEILCD
ncbi:MAG: phosphoenolpyruvate synthase [Gallionellales bacterium GWA2_59_43]|nr:MAG: phosphoenolpyruvate synthase [Gallionellales bacterium GWA2_59_43]